jgi:hypothetical protein
MWFRVSSDVIELLLRRNFALPYRNAPGFVSPVTVDFISINMAVLLLVWKQVLTHNEQKSSSASCCRKKKAGWNYPSPVSSLAYLKLKV